MGGGAPGMSDEANKTAAAIMAVEASRQKRDLDAVAARAGTIPSDNIAREIWSYYEHFIRLLEDRDQKTPGRRRVEYRVESVVLDKLPPTNPQCWRADRVARARLIACHVKGRCDQAGNYRMRDMLGA